jgi:hypothetical protein
MHYRNPIGVMSIAAAFLASIASASAHDESKYPDWKGAWSRIGGPRWDTSKPEWAQEAPLTPEYQAIFEANMADQKAGGEGNDLTYTCLAPGMPRIMMVTHPMEIVITPDTTYLLIDHIHDSRRIFTDGHDWPAQITPSFGGYSIGKWLDTDGDGRYDTLEVETRGMKGPRAFDATGIPLHKDNQTIVKERIYRDKTDPKFLHNEITTIDNALTRPWTVHKRYRFDPNLDHEWLEYVCAENNNHVKIGKEDYFLSAEGLLMPGKKDQAHPDLRYFKQTPK